MSKKIKVNIPGFGDMYCSDDVQYKLYTGDLYVFFKKGTDILHNEYGPAIEDKDGSYRYHINNKYHRLNDYAYYNSMTNCKTYDVIGVELECTKEEFIKNLASILIPKDENE